MDSKRVSTGVGVEGWMTSWGFDGVVCGGSESTVLGIAVVLAGICGSGGCAAVERSRRGEMRADVVGRQTVLVWCLWWSG